MQSPTLSSRSVARGSRPVCAESSARVGMVPEVLHYSYIIGKKGRGEGRGGKNGHDLKRKELENDFISSFTHSWIS